MKSFNRIVTTAAIFVAIGSAIMPAQEAFASSVNVTPVRISLDSRSKAERLSLRNNGDEEIRLQMDVYLWSQNDEGRDQYEPTSDIIVFPKLLSVPKGEERIVRVGLKKAFQVNRERTYRLYIQELPRPQDAKKGVAVTMLMKAGVPIFFAPQRVEMGGTLESLHLVKGTLELKMRNTGTRHFVPSPIMVKGVSADGKELFSKESVGWYLLSGATRVYPVPLTKDECAKAERLDIVVTADTLTMKGSLDVQKDACSP